MIKDNTNAVQSVVRKWSDGILGKFLLAQSCQQHGSTETHGNQTYEENQNIEVGILQIEREMCIFKSYEICGYIHIYKCNRATDAKTNAIHTMQ